jgi:hypothetical protein
MFQQLVCLWATTYCGNLRIERLSPAFQLLAGGQEHFLLLIIPLWSKKPTIIKRSSGTNVLYNHPFSYPKMSLWDRPLPPLYWMVHFWNTSFNFLKGMVEQVG